MKKIFLFALILSLPNFAATLPGGLSRTDVDGVVSKVGFGGATRLMRSTEAYESFPGIKLGMEFGFIPTDDLNAYGDKRGSVPSVMPAPRFYLAKGLFSDLELIFNFFSPNIVDTISTVGGILKWNFYKESESWLSSAAYVGYTRVSAFKGNYSGDDFEMGVYASKDYVRIKPYMGASLLFAHGTLPVENTSTSNTAWESTVRMFLGMEVELLVNLTFQAEMVRLSPAGSMLVAAKF